MKTKRFPFIVIEGIDGVGKTTCAKLLARKINAFYYKTPARIFCKIRKDIENLQDLRLRFVFYLASVFHASSEIDKLLMKKPVVCDRYIYSTIIYHKALGVNLSFIDFNKILISSPDFCFYLFASEDICRRRLIKRGVYSSSDAVLEKNRELQCKINKLFFRLPIIKIDTSKISPNDVCKKIINQLIKK